MNMAESMWASVTNWFTPTVLFCTLNLMIGTIFVSSSLKSRKKHDNHEENNNEETTISHQLFRSPSLLQRVRSINFSLRRSDQPDPFPSTAQCIDSHEEQECESREVQPEAEDHHIMRSQSETSTGVTRKLASVRKMKKSKSEKIVGSDKEKEVDVRPATVRERKEDCSQTTRHEDDEEVDRKADDFINRFRQQLKLQRLDSILRYKEMLSRGAGR